MGSQEQIPSQGSHRSLPLGFHEKLYENALNLKIEKRDMSKNGVGREGHLHPEQRGVERSWERPVCVCECVSMCVCVCGYIRLARFLPVVLTRRAIEQAQ